jgi:hypothetical protein
MWLVVLFVIGLVVWLLARSGGSPSVPGSPGAASLPAWSGPQDLTCSSLLQGGVPARGILLKVGTQRNAKGTAVPGFYEVRAVTIDVEVPGQAPYQCDCTLYVPANLRRLVLPGATLELRLDPRAPRSNIALFGPGVGLSAASLS